MKAQAKLRPISQPANSLVKPIAQFVRSALSQLTRPVLWKRQRDLRICENLSLGNRNFVAVLGYQDQRFLIAGTPTSISLLADVTPDSTLGGGCEEKDLPAA